MKSYYHAHEQAYQNIEAKGLVGWDLGSGSGPSCFMLAQMGFKVTALDISETAIRLGRDLAAQQGLEVDFKLGDVLHLDEHGNKYDLIYDSHCLHCIVFDEDRMAALRGIYRRLLPKGLFVVDTMVFTEGMDLIKEFKTLRMDEDFILWHQTESAELRGVVEYQGQLWCAQRRIYPVLSAQTPHKMGRSLSQRRI